ncbi:MAG TPA: hypothetical protein VK157_01360 [Phycisphaerales bacterium]|nr:hypothetical protein [Phycisphaerales bacterium]
MPRIHTLASLAGLALAASCVSAQPTTPPVYTQSFTDFVTGDNNFNFGGFRFYTIDAAADSYQNDVYERPIAQAFNLINGNYASEEYHSYVDVTGARFGFDNRYAYFAIDVFGRDKRTKDGVNSFEGLKAKYVVRFGADADGRNSYYIAADEPGFAGTPNTVFTNAKTEGYRDTDMDVGGRGGPIHGQPGPSGASVTKTQNLLEEFGNNGYDQQIILSDGLLNGGQTQPVLWQRVSPTDNTVVEIVLDYTALGLTPAYFQNLQFLDFAAVAGGPAGPEAGLWNDAYTANEAGSPNVGIGGDSEFQTQGLVAIYLADNLRPISAPQIPVCDPIDFNNNGVLPEDADVTAFFAVLAGEACAACNDIDFNNNGVFPEDADVIAFFNVLAGGACN